MEMSYDTLVVMGGQWGRWITRSFLSLDKSSRFSVAKNGILGKDLVSQLLDIGWELGHAPIALPLAY